MSFKGHCDAQIMNFAHNMRELSPLVVHLYILMTGVKLRRLVRLKKIKVTNF